MWILADENIDRPIVAWLRGQGHDVVEAATAAPEAADADLIAMSRRAGRILITCAPTPAFRSRGEVARFQEPVGFWLWEPAGGTVVLTRASPTENRPRAGMANSSAAPG